MECGSAVPLPVHRRVVAARSAPARSQPEMNGRLVCQPPGRKLISLHSDAEAVLITEGILRYNTYIRHDFSLVDRFHFAWIGSQSIIKYICTSFFLLTANDNVQSCFSRTERGAQLAPNASTRSTNCG